MKQTILEQRREYQRRSLLAAIERQDEYQAANILAGAVRMAAGDHLEVRQRRRMTYELRRDVRQAIYAGIEALNGFRAYVESEPLGGTE